MDQETESEESLNLNNKMIATNYSQVLLKTLTCNKISKKQKQRYFKKLSTV